MSTTLKATKRTELGSRHARALRREGRIPANLQATAEAPHLDISIDEFADFIDVLVKIRSPGFFHKGRVGGHAVQDAERIGFADLIEVCGIDKELHGDTVGSAREE